MSWSEGQDKNGNIKYKYVITVNEVEHIITLGRSNRGYYIHSHNMSTGKMALRSRTQIGLTNKNNVTEAKQMIEDHIMQLLL